VELLRNVSIDTLFDKLQSIRTLSEFDKQLPPANIHLQFWLAYSAKNSNPTAYPFKSPFNTTQKGERAFKVDVIRLWILAFSKLYTTVSYDHAATISGSKSGN